jgi:hypothetical protein
MSLLQRENWRERWRNSRWLKSRSSIYEDMWLTCRYQSNAGRRKCILFLILLIVGLVIVLVYKPRSSSMTTPEPPDQNDGIVLDPLPDMPPRPGLEDGSETEDLWQGGAEPIADDDL